ncbi:SDR family NAD(P)-dependent oxidoreductase [Halobacillus mangrovi]|uniref:Short-chain dehydrogenase n=1 Tax=Halobacillus mangrovi TaxID=402384 RepID=A0A1W5ZT76_9BACI|nr:SDR family oxidoreductase [Halobacillus mangrovi]ARI76475.1 short-chain dehydrogenase [Halobacillus mangrovi]
MDRFTDTIAVVTGAGSGIGEQAALLLAEGGATVILVGRTLSKLERVAAIINEKQDSKAVVFQADVTKEEDIEALKDFVQSNYGKLHVLINNAGTSGNTTILEMEASEWDRIQDANLKSVYLVSKSLGRLMIDEDQEESDRAIVNVASLSGHKAGAKIPHYSSSKAAVIHFSKSLALELAPYGVRVNSVSPGFAETPLTEEGLKNEKFEQAIKRNTALGRVGKPEEIAKVIAFAASKEASYMTGSDLLVDGGWLIK